MSIDFLLQRFEEEPSSPALVWRDQQYTYGELSADVARWRESLAGAGVGQGDVVEVAGEFSPGSVAALLALIELGTIVVPLTDSVADKRSTFRELAEIEWSIVPERGLGVEHIGGDATHPLLTTLQSEGRPGLILFSSGSTGASKAALHDLVPLLRKFEPRRRPWRAIPFLLFDHIGGFNTLLYSLSNLGCLVIVEERTPTEVCRLIQTYGVQMLPTSPTFLNLLLVSGAAAEYDLSTLEMVTYGTEPMPENTLKRLAEALPHVELKQTYGLSELGILRSKSRSNDSLWVKIGGEGYETRVVDGLLEIKAEAAMRGYLNAPSPFTEDGWFITGDAVEVDGDYMRILGRTTEIINVGGEKVYPAEVEGVLQEMDGVVDVAVSAQAHGLVGQIVFARVQLSTGETLSEFRSRMRKFCAGRLEQFKIPQKIELVEQDLHGQRFKKMRRVASGDGAAG